MNIPSFLILTKRILVCALVLLAMTFAISAQTNEVAWDIDQCANGKRPDPREPCTGQNWVNGNLNDSKSQYSEGDSVMFRLKVTGLTTGSTGNTVTIGFDTTKDGKAAYDYLTTYNRTETGDPCDGVATCNLGTFTTFPIPTDPRVTRGFDDTLGTSDDITQIPGVFTCFGCTITGVSSYTASGSYAGDSTKSITITYTADQPTAVFAWGGHIASRLDWGVNNAAPDISGSPYHMRSLNGGNQDRSLKIGAQAFPAKLTIIKRIGDDEAGSSNLFFGFDKSDGTNPGSADFFLQDNNNDADTFLDRITFDYPLNVGDTATVSITELAVGFGWSLSGLQCVDSEGGLGFTANSSPQPGAWNLVSTTATAVMQSAEFVTCTFENTQGTATAAPVSLGGRVTDSLGNPIAGAGMSLTDTATGATRNTRTNLDGYYTFSDVSTTAFYSLTITAKRYRFADGGTQYFTLTEDNFSMNFRSSN